MGVAWLDEGYSYQPTAGAEWRLLVGDKSALPAILAILECSDKTLPADAFLDVPASSDIRRDVAAPPSSAIHQLPRDNGTEAKPGSLALQAVKTPCSHRAPSMPGPPARWRWPPASVGTSPADPASAAPACPAAALLFATRPHAPVAVYQRPVRQQLLWRALLPHARPFGLNPAG
ncbi:SIP domain-containing protein [Streptomyces sp. 7R007]